MNGFLVRFLALALAVVLVGGVSNASATVTYTIANPYTGAATGYGYADLETFNTVFNGNTYNGILAGGIVISQSASAAAQNGMPASYVTVCTDFEGSLYLGRSYTYSAPASPFNGPGGGLTGIAPPWNNAPLAIQNAAYLFYNYGNLSGGGINGSLTDMAALQLAVWMALYNTDATGHVTGSAFSVTGGSDSLAIADALLWVQGLGGNYGITGSLLQPYNPSNPTQGNPDGALPQELLMANSAIGGGAGGGGRSAVPEPATVLAGTLLLLPLGVSIIRVLRKSPSK